MNDTKQHPMSEDQKQVLEAVEGMTAAFHRGDLDRVMASYEPTATIVFEPGVAVTDEAAQREAFAGFFALSPQFTYAGHEVFVAGDNAIHIAPWTMTGTDPEGGTVTSSGMSVASLRRQADGRWLMTIDDPYGSHLLAGR